MGTQIFAIAASDVKTWWLYLLMGGTVALTVAAFVFVHYLVRSSLNATFETGDGALVIHGGFYGRKTPLDDLLPGQAVMAPFSPGKGYALGMRRNGTSMPGLKSGWFTLRTPRGKEKALLFMTDPDKAVYIPTRLGWSLVVSPEEPLAFLRALGQGG